MERQTRALVAEDWRIFRELRLGALADAPDAFSTTLADAQSHSDLQWQDRLPGSGPTIVAIDQGRTVAMGGAFAPPDSDTATLWGMWTAPEARGRGHGSRVLADLVTWCLARELTVLLDVTEGNAAARRLYVSHGFEPTGEWQPLRDGSPLRVESMRLKFT